MEMRPENYRPVKEHYTPESIHRRSRSQRQVLPKRGQRALASEHGYNAR